MTAQINLAASFAAQTFAIENWVVLSIKVEPWISDVTVVATLECSFGTEYVIAREDGELAYGPTRESTVDAYCTMRGNGTANFRSAPVKVEA